VSRLPSGLGEVFGAVFIWWARAAAAIAKNPEKSNRAIAAELGIAPNSVKAARDRLDEQHCPPAKWVGKDGKSYPARMPVRQESDEDPTDDEPVQPNYTDALQAFHRNCA